MKKLLFLLMLLTALPLCAQKWSIAPRVGVNLTNILGGDVGGSMKTGLNIGAGVEYRFTRVFALEPGVYYSMQGFKDEDITLKSDYINIPLLAKAYIKSGFHVFGGPQLGIKILEKIKYTEDQVNLTMDSDYILPLDFSLVAGMGYQFNMGFLLTANYNIGISQARHNDGITQSRNSVFQISAGWRF